MGNYETQFADLFCENIPRLVGKYLYTGERRTKGRCWCGITAGAEGWDFMETSLQNCICDLALPNLAVNKLQPELDDESRIDYALFANDAIVAICETKGPVRATFFEKRSRNYIAEVELDVTQQRKRKETAPAVEAYLALLAYGCQTEIAQRLEESYIRREGVLKGLNISYREALSPQDHKPVTVIMVTI